MKRKTLFMTSIVLAIFMTFSLASNAFTTIGVKSLRLNKTSLTLAVGKTATLTAAVSPANATDKTVSWSSSDSKIAKVNSKGVVTAVKVGKATITAKSKDGKAVAKCTVTVSLAGAQEKKSNKLYLFNNSGTPWVSQKPQSDKKDRDLVHQKILDETGIDVISIIPPVDTWQDKLNLMLASNDEIDLFAADDFRTYQSQDALLPLNTLLDKYGGNLKKQWKTEWDESWKVLSIDGKIYGIPTLPPLFENPIYVRTDWLQKIGRDKPKTMQEFEEVLKLFKEKDPAGNGKTIPLITRDWKMLSMSLAAGFMDVGFGDWMDKDGKIKPIVMNPGYKDFVSMIADWYTKGYIYKESFTIKVDRQKELVAQNMVATAAVNETAVTTPAYQLQQSVKEAKYEVIDNLKGPKGNIGTCSDVPLSCWVIPKKSKNAENAMKYMNWVQTNLDSYLTVMYGIEGRNWEYVDKTQHIVNRLNSNYISDFLAASSFAFTVQWLPSDPASRGEFEYYQKYVTDLNRVKKPFTYGTACKYSLNEIDSKLPNKADIDRLIEQEITKFMMGVRPMSEYDNFLQQLKSAGLDQWSKVMTEQYNAHKSK